jgi:large subunit ribosomal protein L6e
LNDTYFTKTTPKATCSAEEEFFENGKHKAKAPLPESRAADQKAIDNALLSAIKKTENLSKYLKVSWGLSKGQFPHQLVF